MKYSLSKLYNAIGISRQAVNKQLHRDQQQAEIKAQLLYLIMQIRIDHPTMALRSMYYKTKPQGIGRDRFEFLCAEWGLMLEKKRNYRVTTDSSGVIRFPNLIESIKLTRINQVWVSDITYFEMNKRFYYLTFISDMFSKMIKGHSVSVDLRTINTTIPALQLALKRIKLEDDLILHSDGGGQYYCTEFLAITSSYGIKNSMAKTAYENPQAERVNGIIKNNYLYYWNPNTYSKLLKMVDKSVYLFNYEKPHKSLKYLTPYEYEKKFTFETDNLSKAKSRQRQNRATIGASSPSVAGQPVSDSDVSPAKSMYKTSLNLSTNIRH